MGGVSPGVDAVPIVGQPVAYGIGFVVLLLVVGTGSWAGSLVTVVHEAGHMIVAALSFRGHRGFTLRDGGGGATEIQDGSWGVGDLLGSFIGYAMPPLVGLGGAALVAHDRAWSVVWVGVVLLLLSFVFSRNGLAALVTFLAGAGVVAAALVGSHAVQAAVAVGLVWWLLLGGVRSAWITSTRFPSDAYRLARRTWIPAGLWKLTWVLLALIILIVGAQLLLRPGYTL